jgi:hypothetical protein
MSRDKSKLAPKPVEEFAVDNIVEFPAKRSIVSSSQQVNTRELCSIRAMAAYVAHNQNVREETVRAFLEAEFSVGDIAQIERNDFERVIAYLVDLRCEMMIN